MSETETSPENLEAFRNDFIAAVESSISILISGQDEEPFDIDPFSLGLGDETLPDLSSKKADIIEEELAKLLGRTSQTQPVSVYDVLEGEQLSVLVFEGTQQDEEGNDKHFYLHEIEHPDGALDWQLSASQDPLL